MLWAWNSIGPQAAIAIIFCIIFALTVHEAAHAWMAMKRGDWTAKLQGRLTLNPIVHLDLWGSICFLLLPFGWAKPVPVDIRNLKDAKKDNLLIALAGPVSNVILALLFAAALHLSLPLLAAFGASSEAVKSLAGTGLTVLYLSVTVNVLLAVFNMFPIFPLDGEKVLMGLLPWRQAETLESLRPYGPMVFLVLIMSGFFEELISIVTDPILGILLPRALLG